MAKAFLNRKELELFFTNGDFKRLSHSARNMAGNSLVTDLLPTIASLYYNDKISSSVILDIRQSAVLLSMGLQRKNADVVAAELGIPESQMLANFNKAMLKFSNHFDALCMSAIEESAEVPMSAVDTLYPTSTTLEEDLNAAEQEIRARQSRDKHNLLEELGIERGQLSQFAIKASSDEWAGALASLRLTNARPGGILSIKAPKRAAKPQELGQSGDDSTEPNPKRRPGKIKKNKRIK